MTQAQTTNYKDMVLVTIHYASSGGIGTPAARVSQATYCGQPLGPIGQRVQANNQFVTEMWYRMSPQSGNCEVKVLYVDAAGKPADAGHRIASATIFHNVNETSPIASTFTKVFTGSVSANPRRIELSGTGPRDTVLMCALTGYPNGGDNILTPEIARNQFWSHNGLIGGFYRNAMAALGVSFTRTSENQNMILSWTTRQSMPWSAACANIKSKPFSQAVPTPMPTPVPSKTPIPALSVDLIINNSNGPIKVSREAAVALSWISTGATSCTASGGWSGSKALSGTETSTAFISGEVVASSSPSTSTRVSYQASVPEGSVWYWRVRSAIPAISLYSGWPGSGILKVAFRSAPGI